MRSLASGTERWRSPGQSRRAARCARRAIEPIVAPTEESMDKERSERAEALIARMKKARGYIYPEWEFAARQDPDFVDAYNRIYELGLGEGRHVSAKVREFIVIALLALRGSGKEDLVAQRELAYGM